MFLGPNRNDSALAQRSEKYVAKQHDANITRSKAITDRD